VGFFSRTQVYSFPDKLALVWVPKIREVALT